MPANNNIEMLTPVPLHASIFLQFVYCFYCFLTRKRFVFLFEKRELSVLLISLEIFYVRNIGKVLVSVPRPSLMGTIVALSIMYKMEICDLPPLCQKCQDSSRQPWILLFFLFVMSLTCILSLSKHYDPFMTFTVELWKS